MVDKSNIQTIKISENFRLARIWRKVLFFVFILRKLQVNNEFNDL